MGLRIRATFGRMILAALVLVPGISGRSWAVTASWPSALTGVTPDVVRQMKLPLRDQILALADKYGERTDVPYVWGGNAIGDPATCQACRACVEAKGKTRLKNRLKVCAPCRQCGIDCSHFATRFFKEAGMDLPYATTGTMKRMSDEALRTKMGLVDMGRNLSDARPGDLLLHNHHVTILLKLHSPTNGDVLHSSRSNKRGKMGGVEIARDKNLLRFRGRLLKILRREELVEEDDAPTSFTRLDEVLVRKLASQFSGE